MFVVAVSTIADDVNENIFKECLSVLHSDFHDLTYKLGFVCIDMDDGGLNSFGNISAVQACPGLSWCGCKADLIVRYNMDDPMIGVMVQISHL